jgi:serine protease AprX
MLNPSEKLRCPLCKKIVTPDQFAGALDIEPAATLYLQKQNPDWRPEQGVCPDCLQTALDALLEEAQAKKGKMETPVYGILPIGLRLGYSAAYNGSGITLAFLDSGFSDHPDLKGRIKAYIDASTPEIRELEAVETAGVLSWHGTMTSVVACGDGSRSNGLYRGLASGAELVLIRVSDPKGRVNEETIGRGLSWLLANHRRFGVQIVNISVGGDQPHDYFQNPVDLMVEALMAQGLLVVCASGNAGERKLVPPASAPSAVTVGGLDDKNNLDSSIVELWHSNYGRTRTGVWKPELVAPSLWLAAPVLPDSALEQGAVQLAKILPAEDNALKDLLEANLENLAIFGLSAENLEQSADELREILWQAWHSQKLINPYYQHVEGTSFAAPIVSSVAAQMWQANPTLTPSGLKDLLLRTARYLPEIAPDQQGHGVVDPWAAVVAAHSTAQSGV